MNRNRHGHSVWTEGPRPGTCRFCGEPNANEAYTCPELKPRLAAREAKARAEAARCEVPGMTPTMAKVYTDAKCPHCGKDLFSSIPPWEAKKGQKIKVDTCLTHGKVA